MLSTLIIEDNAVYRQSLHHLLAERFPMMLIAEAADGEHALRQALDQRFDLIFMDIRLPKGNGLALTKTIKAVWVDSMICVITNHDILEYRETAFQSGADHFMVKGDTTEPEIVDLVESWLRTRFITLIVVSESLPRKQLNMLLSVHWPVMVVAEAESVREGLEMAAALKPDLVLLDLGLPGIRLPELVRDLKAASAQASIIGMSTNDVQACRAKATGLGMAHCVSLGPMGHTELVAIVKTLQPGALHH